MKSFIIIGIIGTLLSIFLYLFIFNTIINAGSKAYSEYKSKPDTTIIIKNGKPDTTITINK